MNEGTFAFDAQFKMQRGEFGERFAFFADLDAGGAARSLSARSKAAQSLAGEFNGTTSWDYFAASRNVLGASRAIASLGQ
jgi:hypothetical protein